MKKDLTRICDLNKNDILEIINKAFYFKDQYDKGIRSENILNGKVVAMIFEKQSLRTKVAFEVATAYLGGIPIFLPSAQILSAGKNTQGRESIYDIAKNLERFADLIMARVYDHSTILGFSSAVKKPIINLLCNKYHPTQALADLMVIKWHKKDFKGLKIAFIGDGNNVSTSLMHICAIVGIDFVIASPKKYEINDEEKNLALEYAKISGANIIFTNDSIEAASNADVIYADTFISMGEEDIRDEKIQVFNDYQINSSLVSHAKSDFLFMHCLPAHRGEEVTDEIMDGNNSIIFDQAECRMHIAKSLIYTYLKF